ncbi:hypothetical protein Cni_G16386 [Canna indica]|uniref:BED-type domain-containing protein n=1 Tax=Canna indica TaxID=4628 RepID=A0AAQ3QCI6_9LILI|nr:hypothetical protein Cni_G16386 [Canna indica]
MPSRVSTAFFSSSTHRSTTPLMFKIVGSGIGSTGTTRGATSRTRKKNIAENRTDIGWKREIDIKDNDKKVKCNYCSKTFSGGIFRFKHHLASTREDSEPCATVPQEVKEMMLKIITEAEASLKKIKFDEDFSEETEKDNSSQSKGKCILNFVTKGRGDGTQVTINRMMKKDLKEQVDYQCDYFSIQVPCPLMLLRIPSLKSFVRWLGDIELVINLFLIMT